MQAGMVGALMNEMGAVRYIKAKTFIF